MSVLPALHVQLLGDFRVVYRSASVTTINGARLQSLFAYLLLHRDSPQPRQHIAFLLWPDSTEAHARGSLRKLLHQLSAALPHAEDFLDINSQSLQWRLDSPFTLDVADFENAASDVTSISALRRAIELYRGDLVPSCYDDWIIPERERLRQLFTTALERLLLLLERQRDFRTAINYAHTLLRHDPVYEETYRHLMRLYSTSGDRAGALRTYHTCATVLQRELNVEPSPATHEMYERILNLQESSVSAVTLVAAVRLIGRQQEWARLQSLWHRAAEGQPAVALISGEAGIGKTRLAEELLDWARRQGIATARSRAYAAEGNLAYAPVAAWLRARPLPPLAAHWRSEIARVLPELLTEDSRLTPPGPLTEAWQRQHLFEALARALLEGSQPLLLLMDDIQWCDRETLEWLHYFLRFDPRARVLILATMRPEEVTDDHPVLSLLAALRRSGQIEEIGLGPLDPTETSALARQITGREPDSKFIARLYEETEGNSLFVVEFLRAHVLEPGGQQEASHPSGLPPTVQSVIRARLAQLSPAARELASLAAAVGREFTIEVLRQVSGSAEETIVRSLDELWQRRIVREHGTEGYDFTHDKLREVVYAELSAARRRFFHSRIASALATLHASNLEAVSAEIAAHLEQAGLIEQAIPYYERGAAAAQRLAANQEALALYQHALELIERVPPANEMRRLAARLDEGLGDVLELMTKHDEANVAYQNALKFVPPHDALATARLYRKIGNTYKSQGRYQEALHDYARAEVTMGQAPSDNAASWWEGWIQLHFDRFALQYGRADINEMIQLAEKVKPVVEQHGTSFQRAHLYQLFLQINFRRDRYVISDETLGYERAAFAAIQESGDPNRINAFRFNLGFGLLWRGLLGEAEEQLLRALEWNEQVGDIYEKTLSLTYLTILYRKRGRVDEAHHYAIAALEQATSAKTAPYIATAKANLAWVAWKQGKFNEAEAEAREAVNRWEPTYPFQWTALLPLIAIALRRHRTEEAVQYARNLFESHQQRLPDALAANLQQGIQFWEQSEKENARVELSHAIEHSRQMGYL